MASSLPPPGDFQPGDKVRIKTGAFAGMTGTVLSAKDAESRGFPVCDWNVVVLLTTFGHEVPAHFEPQQLEPGY